MIWVASLLCTMQDTFRLSKHVLEPIEKGHLGANYRKLWATQRTPSEPRQQFYHTGKPNVEITWGCPKIHLGATQKIQFRVPKNSIGGTQKFNWGCPKIHLGATQKFYCGCPKIHLGVPKNSIGVPKNSIGGAQKFNWGYPKVLL